MKRNRRIAAAVVALLAAVLAAVLAGSGLAGPSRAHHAATPPPGNTVEQWNKIAEDTVVGSGAFQNESQIYMAYESTAVYDAVTAIQRGYSPIGPQVAAPSSASPDAAVVEAAYRALSHYFPTQSSTLGPLYDEALAAIPNGSSKSAGQAVGRDAARTVINLRRDDGRMTPIGTTSSFPTLPPGPGVWRLTPAAYLAPQTPWVGQVRPFVLQSGDQFLPPPPPSLQSTEWVSGFNEIKAWGDALSHRRTAAETATAKFFTANAIRQYNGVARSIVDARGLGLLETARLAAMVNVVGADAQISVMNAKYHYLFWRPVTAIDPTSVTNDGFGQVPGADDGNPATVEQAGWRPLVNTPNHPEYPAAHGSLTGAMSVVFTSFLGTSDIDLDIHGFDPNGAPGNLDAVQHFATARDLRREIVNARVWAGLHYRFSGLAGVRLGRAVARYDLAHAFQPVG